MAYEDVMADTHERKENVMKACVIQTSGGYSCLRGPRPSGAILYVHHVAWVDNQLTESVLPIYGFVQPVHDAIPTCKEEGECMMENGHCVRNLHAEVAAILIAAKDGHSTNKGVLFSINKPCYNCTMHAIAAGIKTIYYAYAVYDEERTRQALEAAGVECIHVPVE